MVRVTNLARDHCDSIALSIARVGSSPNQLRKPPPLGWLKINLDATFVKGKAQSGCIIRNKNGSILLASTHSHTCIDSITAESLALLKACKLLHHLQIKEAIIEDDSLNAISFIQGVSGSVFWTASPVIDKIRKFWNYLPK